MENEMNTILLDINLLLNIAGVVITVSAVAGIVWKILKPLRDVLQQLKELERRSKLDYEKLNRLESRQRVIGETCWAVCAHIAEGNHSGEMTKALERLSKNLMFGDDE
jgi:hypothetical protein